ncbi:MAG: hypothetical protein ABI323_09060 [Solirubrobacteraceae bacterium]
MPKVLIELPGGEGVVRRDDGEIVVTADLSDGRGQRSCMTTIVICRSRPGCTVTGRSWLACCRSAR